MSKIMSKLVYIGMCTTVDKKAGGIMREIKEDGSLGVELVFDRKALQGASVGSVYEVEPGEKADSWKLAAKRYLHRYGDEIAVAQWQLGARAVQLTEDMHKAERAAAKELPAAFGLMAPLREIYRKQLPNGKRAIESLLLEYLRRGL